MTPWTQNEVLYSLVRRHIARYTYRRDAARQGLPGYREMECEHYLHLWEGIRAKGCELATMTSDEVQELAEAVYDEQLACPFAQNAGHTDEGCRLCHRLRHL